MMLHELSMGDMPFFARTAFNQNTPHHLNDHPSRHTFER
jgi:hypothetical protein